MRSPPFPGMERRASSLPQGESIRTSKLPLVHTRGPGAPALPTKVPAKVPTARPLAKLVIVTVPVLPSAPQTVLPLLAVTEKPLPNGYVVPADTAVWVVKLRL